MQDKEDMQKVINELKSMDKVRVIIKWTLMYKEKGFNHEHVKKE